jgi:hypothetical protein
MNANQIHKFITKLNRDTKEDLIVWNINNNVSLNLAGTETLLDSVYFCKVLDKYLRLFRLKSKYYYDEGLYEWVEEYRLDFVDNLGKSEWTFPSDRAIGDLYDTVRYKTSNVQTFLDKFLAEDEEEN